MEVYELDRARIAAALKEGWQAMRTFQSEPTIDILRYAVSGEDDALVVEGTETLVPGLASLDAAVFPRSKKRKRVEGLVAYADSDLVFIIYDTEVLMTDRLLYHTMEYEVRDINYNSVNGRCRVEASRVK